MIMRYRNPNKRETNSIPLFLSHTTAFDGRGIINHGVDGYISQNESKVVFNTAFERSIWGKN